MATYTTNYNLEKPDESDNFGDFRASYNSNMDIIDQNLGGGGGGGGGGGELYLDNGLIGSDSGVYVTCNLDKTLVNGFYLVRVYDSSNSSVGWYNLKWSGTTQTLSVLSGGQLQITSTTAGLTYYSGNWRNIYCDILSLGSGGGGGLHIYSTTEREVGQWIDGKSVYERTFDLTSLSCASQTWTDTGISKGTIDMILHAQVFSDNGTYYNSADVNVTTNTNHIGIKNETDASISVRYIVLEYTKDVAPPIHYIEYIQSTGTQYIDTGITPTINTSFEITLSDVQSTGAQYGEVSIFGAGYYANNSYLLTKDGGGASPITWYYPRKQTVIADIISKHKIELYRGSITVDDVVVSSDTSVSSTSFGAVTLFKVANGYFSAYKLYAFKMYENGNLIFEGLPVKDTNDVPCLYDTVSDSYLYNNGTGDFIAGGDL